MDCCKNPASGKRHAHGLATWALPAAILALIPKCPVCVAGYFFFFTGATISISTADCLRTLIIGLCVATIGFAIIRKRFGN